MENCEYCGTSIFFKPNAVRWEDLIGANECERAFEGKHQPYQLAEFYCEDKESEKLFETTSHILHRAGSMRLLTLDDTPILKSSQLKAFGIWHDIALEMALEEGRLRTVACPSFIVREKATNKSVSVHARLDDALGEMVQKDKRGGMVTIAEAVDEVLDTLSSNSSNSSEPQ